MKSNLFLFSVVCLLFMAGCATLPKQLSQGNIKVDPSVLEMKNSKIDATLTATFPQGYVPARGVITVTPVLKYKDRVDVGSPVTYQGEKVTGNGKAISSNGGTYSQPVSFDYNDQMRKAQLFARVSASVGKKSTVFPDIWVADGTNATVSLASAEHTAVAIGPDKFQRIIEQKQEADIKFLIQQAGIRNTELKKEEIQSLVYSAIAAQKDINKDVKSLSISAYASPDGAYKMNEKLAEQRGNNTQKQLQSQLKKNEISGTAFSVDETAEDWDGFKALMEKSNIEDKDLILRVLSMHSDPETREREIKNLSSAYKEVTEQILPQLRRSKLQLTVDVIGKSDADIQDLAKNNPSKLSVEELLYAATLTDDLDQKQPIYELVKSLFPNDWRGFNNMGVIQYKKGNFQAAKSSFQAANTLNSTVPEIQNNLAVMSLMDGDVNNAQLYLGKAGGVKEVSTNLGLVDLVKGDYAQAVTQYGDENSNNAVVAHILTKDYASATKLLASQSNKDALSYYLAAIVAARTNNSSLVSSNLAKSFEADPKYKSLAASDVEFSKFPDAVK